MNKRFIALQLVALVITGVCGCGGGSIIGHRDEKALSPAVITDLGPFLGSDKSVRSINIDGCVVGYNDNKACAWPHEGNRVNLPCLSIDDTVPGLDEARAMSINGNGIIAGNKTDSIDRQIACIWNQDRTSYRDIGSLISIDAANFSNNYLASAEDINDKGVVVGYCTANSRRFHAFVYNGIIMRDIGVLDGGAFSKAYSCNETSQVVGVSGTSSSASHAFLYDYATNKMIDLGTLQGTDNSEAVSINNKEETCGFCYSGDSDISIAAIWKSRKPYEIVIANAVSARANCINNSSQVVGNYETSIAVRDSRAFVWTDNKATDLNTLLPSNTEWILNTADSINDDGQIAGIGTLKGIPHAYVLTLPG